MHIVLRSSSGLCNSFLAASFRSQSQGKEFHDSQQQGRSSLLSKSSANDALDSLLPVDESNYSSSPNSSKSFGDSQLEIFNYQHGILILHLLAALLFMPSLVAWLQVNTYFSDYHGFNKNCLSRF